MNTESDITVRGYHVDHFGHVNHGRFVELLEEARWRYLECNNLLEGIHEAGAIHVVSKLEINYRRPARASDILRFHTRLTSRTHYGFWMEQTVCFRSTDKPVLYARIFNVFVNTDGRPQEVNQRMLEIWPDLASAEIDE
jgi:thioesterase-3